MNRKASFCLIGLMGLAGCTAADPVASTDQATQSTVSAEDGAVSFVSLKVPNMH